MKKRIDCSMTKRPTNSAETEHRELILVQAGERLLGLFADEVSCIERGRGPTPLPHAPAAVLGVVSVRGRILTLLDPLALLGERKAADARPDTSPAFILALRGDEQLALAVESDGRPLEISDAEIELASGDEARIAHGTLKDGEATILVLDVSRLFDAAVEGLEERRRQRILTDER